MSLLFLCSLFVLLGVYGVDVSYASGDTTTITGQVFCDNFCQIYYNGDLIYDQTSSRRVFTTSFSASRSGTRTFAAVLFDNPYDENQGIWQFSSSLYLKNNTLLNLWCLGDGGFRAVFNDSECGDSVGTSGEWKCMAVRTGPLNAEDCFVDGFKNDSTYSNPVERGTVTNTTGLRLYDPCIENPINNTRPLLDSCEETVISDYDQSWLNSGYNASSWDNATTYTLDEALPKRGRPATWTLEQNCTNTDYYCDPKYSEASWGSTQFIWSDDIELDNVVLCRYEYVVDDCQTTTQPQTTDDCSACCDSSSMMSSTISSTDGMSSTVNDETDGTTRKTGVSYVCILLKIAGFLMYIHHCV